MGNEMCVHSWLIPLTEIRVTCGGLTDQHWPRRFYWYTAYWKTRSSGIHSETAPKCHIHYMNRSIRYDVTPFWTDMEASSGVSLYEAKSIKWLRKVNCFQQTRGELDVGQYSITNTTIYEVVTFLENG